MLRRASDDRLVAGVRAGDDAAFEVIYDRHHREVLGFCRHMLGDHAEGEDALQYTFVSALGALRADDRPVRLRPWLFAIARNRCLSMLRARRHVVPLDELEPSVAGLAPEVERRADLRELLADLRRLPDDQREALVLSELGALGHDEIAEVLLVPREKVKALVFQAREHLAAWREARGDDCRAIQEELSTVRGAKLRRAGLRRHLEVCDGCRAFDGEVRRQRAALGLILPVAPGVGLKGSVLASALGVGAAGAGAGGAGLVAGGGALGALKGLGAKALVVTAVAGGAATTGYVAVEEVQRHDPPAAQVVEAAGAKGSPRAAAVAPAAAVPIAASTAATPAPDAAGRKARAKGKGKGKGKGREKGRAGVKPHVQARGKGKEKDRAARGIGHTKKAKAKVGEAKAKPEKVKAKAKPEKVKGKARPERRAAAHVKPERAPRTHSEQPAKLGAPGRGKGAAGGG